MRSAHPSFARDGARNPDREAGSSISIGCFQAWARALERRALARHGVTLARFTDLPVIGPARVLPALNRYSASFALITDAACSAAASQAPRADLGRLGDILTTSSSSMVLKLPDPGESWDCRSSNGVRTCSTRRRSSSRLLATSRTAGRGDLRFFIFPLAVLTLPIVELGSRSSSHDQSTPRANASRPALTHRRDQPAIVCCSQRWNCRQLKPLERRVFERGAPGGIQATTYRPIDAAERRYLADHRPRLCGRSIAACSSHGHDSTTKSTSCAARGLEED